MVLCELVMAVKELKHVGIGTGGCSCVALRHSRRGPWLFLSVSTAVAASLHRRHGHLNFCDLRGYVRNIVQQVLAPRESDRTARSSRAVPVLIFVARCFHVVPRRAAMAQMVVTRSVLRMSTLAVFVDLTLLAKPFYLNASNFVTKGSRLGPKRHKSHHRFDEEERSLCL